MIYYEITEQGKPPLQALAWIRENSLSEKVMPHIETIIREGKEQVVIFWFIDCNYANEKKIQIIHKLTSDKTVYGFVFDHDEIGLKFKFDTGILGKKV